jgi:hypothetical protein
MGKILWCRATLPRNIAEAEGFAGAGETQLPKNLPGPRRREKSTDLAMLRCCCHLLADVDLGVAANLSWENSGF